MQSFTHSFGNRLTGCFIFIGAMIAARIFYSGSIHFLFLVWNLFLAWIPYGISLSFNRRTSADKLMNFILFSGWLLFFPNALYVITDIIHHRETTLAPFGSMPFFYLRAPSQGL